MFKKGRTILLGSGISFLLLVVSLLFYAEDASGNVAENTTDMPVLFFFIGCYLIPRFLKSKERMHPSLRKLTVLLFGWSSLFTWVLLAITEGYFSPMLNLVSFIGSVVLPLGVFYRGKRQFKKMDETIPTSTKLSTPTQVAVASLDSVEVFLQQIDDADVHQKVVEVNRLLAEVKKQTHTLDVEEVHAVDRLSKTDMPLLLNTYVSLNKTQQTEAESLVLNNLLIIQSYLQSILDGVSKEQLANLDVAMHLIEERYQK